MKKLIVVIGLLVLFGNSYSQSGWYVQYYSPAFTNYSNSMFFVDSLTGWFHPFNYSQSNISKTINGGISWNATGISNEYVTSIYFINQNTGWLTTGSSPGAGNYGSILKSTNSGSSWTSQVIPINESPIKGMTSVKFLNLNTGFSCGFVEYLSGQALLIDTYVLKTTNGGTNWNVSLRITTGDINDDPPYFKKLDFADENCVWVTGFKNIFYHTTNGGANWNFTAINMGGNNVDLKLINAYTGFVFCSYNWQYPNWARLVLKSTNGGYNFSAVYSSVTHRLNGFCFTDANNGWICGDSNLILRTTNGGINWTTQNSPIFANYKRVYFYNSNTGWMADDSGHILKTTTGGISFIRKIGDDIPYKFSLSQNYPNPFNPTTNIKYQITNNKFVTLKVFNILGKEIATLVNEKQNAGTYEVTFDGSGLTSGVYFYRLTCGDFLETRKMLLIK